MTVVDLIAGIGAMIFLLAVGGVGIIMLGIVWGTIFKALNVSGPWDRWSL